MEVQKDCITFCFRRLHLLHASATLGFRVAMGECAVAWMLPEEANVSGTDSSHGRPVKVAVSSMADDEERPSYPGLQSSPLVRSISSGQIAWSRTAPIHPTKLPSHRTVAGGVLRDNTACYLAQQYNHVSAIQQESLPDDPLYIPSMSPGLTFERLVAYRVMVLASAMVVGGRR